MGSGSSRLGGSRPPLARRPGSHHPHQQRCRPSFKRTFSSLLICGASSSSQPHSEMEGDPAELLVNSAEHSHLEKIHFPTERTASLTDNQTEYPWPRVANGLSSEKAICHSGNHSRDDASVDFVAKKTAENLSKEEMISTSRSVDNIGSNEAASSSRRDEFSPESVVPNRTADINVVDNGKGLINGIGSGNSMVLKFSNGPSSDAPGESSDEMSLENTENEVMIFRGCGSTSGPCSGSAPSDSPLDNAFLHASSSGVGSSVADREEDHRNGHQLQIDMANHSSNNCSSSSSGLTSHGSGRNMRRLFWDSFSRCNFRRNADSRTFLIAADDAEGLGSHDRLRLDSSGDMFDDEIIGDSRSYSSSNRSTNEQRSHSGSELWERSGDVDIESVRRAAFCPSGIHLEGTCSCTSISTAEESGARASISRIVLLAEALFEVLDEVHRQPLSLSLPVLSIPAPESVVDSLPVKNYCRPERTEGRDEAAQCYICLAEYNDGDEIRVLPCHHDFHVSCIDKWLKEIHGVCPLCRGDVREVSSEGYVSI